MSELKVGSPVLYFGRMLAVIELFTKENGKPLARVTDPKLHKQREDLRKKVKALRAEQATEDKKERARAKAEGDIPSNSPRWNELRREIEALSKSFEGKYFSISLRRDLLKWWPAKKCFAKDGMILSDDQMEAFVELMGKRPTSKGHRAALLFLESTAGEGGES